MPHYGETTDSVGSTDLIADRASRTLLLNCIRRIGRFRSTTPLARNLLDDLAMGLQEFVRTNNSGTVDAGELRMFFEPKNRFREAVSSLAADTNKQVAVAIIHGWPILYLRESQFLRWTKARGTTSPPSGGPAPALLGSTSPGLTHVGKRVPA